VPAEQARNAHAYRGVQASSCSAINYFLVGYKHRD